MTKENILFSIIGVLLGIIIGFVFATNLQQSSIQRAPAGTASSAQDSELPEDHPPIPGGDGADPTGESSRDSALIEKAHAEPNNFEAQMEGAKVLYRNRRFDEAIELLVRANSLQPQDYEAVVGLGNANFDTGRYEIAEKWYTAALVKNPKDVNVRTDLGLSLMFRVPPDYDGAIREFRGSLETEPGHEQTLQNLVVALTKRGDFGEAETTLKKLSEVSPGNSSLTKLRTDLQAARALSKPKAGAGKRK